MNKLKYILSFVLAGIIGACSTVDFGDINNNTNGPISSSYTTGLLAGAIMNYATQTGRDGLMKPTLYVQYQSQVTYTDEMLYSETPSSWFSYYVVALSNLQEVIDYCNVPENQTSALINQGSVNNQIGVSMIMKAIIMKRVTDTWGDVPYSQALKGLDNLSPAYDKQLDIYQTLITELKNGRDLLNAGENAPAGDIIYDGNVNMWKKLANSVILQMSLTLSNKFPGTTEYAATEFNAALNHGSGVIETLNEEAWFKYEDKPGFRNPWNANRTRDYFLSKEFTDALNGNAGLNPTSNTAYDARLEVYADNPANDGVPYGFAGGSGAGAASVSNDNYWNNTTPLPLMTASYTFLNRAEAADLGWTTENVTLMLEDGITMSYRTLENLSGLNFNENAYVASRVSDAIALSFAQVIGEEKWVSLFGQGFDAWTEWRRTGFPVLTPATDFFNDGNIPTRYLYPLEEGNLNGTNRDAGITQLTPQTDKNTSKVWWDN